MEKIRLQKFIADAGIMSRRAAEGEIERGNISVNGHVAGIGTKIDPASDVVTYKGKRIRYEKKQYTYIMLNKPTGYMTTVRDEEGRPTVMDLISDISKRVYPVGRLDCNTEGLLLMSNDGDFTYKITHPKHKLDKTYEVFVSGNAEKNALRKLEQGVFIDGKKTAPAVVDIADFGKNSALLTITIHEGRNRQVRKMCASVGFKVMGLKRVSEGGLSLGNLPLGRWRHLTGAEVERILKNTQM